MKEFGWAGCLIVCAFAAYAINEVCLVFGFGILPANYSLLVAIGYALIPTLFFAFNFRAFGRPMFIFLLLVMVLLATTELGTDSWISDLLTPVLKSLGPNAGNWVLVYTSAVMFCLRFFAGPLAHRLTPVGLLICCSLIAAIGLFCLAHAGTTALLVVAAATFYAAGKSFFWPSMLGVVSEQFPRGGALTINAIAGVGMISVGVLGGPFLGTLKDVSLDANLQKANPALHAVIADPAQQKFGFTFQPLDKTKIEALPQPDQAQISDIVSETNQTVLAEIAILPATMFLCYLFLGLYFRQRGGYQQIELVTDR
jgi:hypothetical protein